MKFLIAPNAFKGTIAADKAASIIEQAIVDIYPGSEPDICPIADGGDGTCDLLASQLDLQKLEICALNAVGRPGKGHIYLDKAQKTAYIDVSAVSGLGGLKSYEIDAKVTSTFGSGELVSYAAEMGAEQIVLGLGGSATVDLGTGILRALGFLFLDAKGRELPMFSPGFLSRIAYIQRPVHLSSLRFTCLCDVKNSFFGEKGAIPVFGPQKGLRPEDLESFEQSTLNFYKLLQQKSSSNLSDRPGYGAAGGIAMGLSAFFPVIIEKGAQFFFEKTGMAEKIRNVDVVITGEGRFDAQSAGGKGSYEILQLAKSLEKKVILITSGTEGSESGFDEIIRLEDLDMHSAELKSTAEKNLFQAVSDFMKH